MMRAIQPHDQFLRFAVEIDNVGWNRVLTAKLQSVEPAAAQVEPEFLFRIRGRLPEIADMASRLARQR